LFHLERVSQILDTPACYGLRLEFLDIEMTKEEQLAFIATRDMIIERLQSQLERIVTWLESPDVLKGVPVDQIKEFKKILDSIAGYDPFHFTRLSILSASSIFGRGGHINDLQVPLQELQEFEQILNRIVRSNDPLSRLSLLPYTGIGLQPPTVQDLRVPIETLREYENTLNRIVEQLREVKRLQAGVNST
jgi:hypothetical protein